MLLGLGRVPMPCDDENGLFPGRGAPAGRVPIPCDDENGLFPGRAPGFAPVSSGDAAAGATGAGVDGADGTSDAVGMPGLVGLGAGDASAVGASAGADAVAAGAADDAAALEDDFAAGAWSAGTGLRPSASSAARSFRATGGSIVEETPLTNSPKSFSFARAIFESIPYSCAIS